MSKKQNLQKNAFLQAIIALSAILSGWPVECGTYFLPVFKSGKSKQLNVYIIWNRFRYHTHSFKRIAMTREKRVRNMYMCDSSDSDSDNDSDTDESESSEQNKNNSLCKNSGAANIKHNPSWGQIYPVKAVPVNHHSCFCIPCGKKIRCGHQCLRCKSTL